MLEFIKETRKLRTPSGSSRKMALYKCSCGKVKEICMRNVRLKIAKSCGCLNKRQITELGKRAGNWSTKHGMFGTRFYNIYYGMRMRCSENSVSNSKYYSDKGIKCLWKTFEDFKSDMYESYLSHMRMFGEKNTSLDRINSSKHYYKGNCRWATCKEQAKEKVGNKSLISNLRRK